MIFFFALLVIVFIGATQAYLRALPSITWKNLMEQLKKDWNAPLPPPPVEGFWN